ncbi:WYL domain-containing protein [Vibrio sp. PNB23_22_7]
MKKINTCERFAFLEMLATWQGFVRNKDLQHQFGITRQQAYQDIKSYQRCYPNRLDKMPTGPYRFVPHVLACASKPPLEQYLQWMTTGQFYVDNPHSVVSFGESLPVPERYVTPQVIAALTQAIRERKRLELGYVSLSNPEWEGRVFHPHTVVKTCLRWHVRGYCEKSQDYRDLVLSRCRGEVEVLDESPYSASDDTVWNTMICLILSPDPRLTTAQQEVIAHDYQMDNGQFHLSVRAALVNYVLKEMQVNTKYLEGAPEAQQLVLVNRNDVKPWLFNS